MPRYWPEIIISVLLACLTLGVYFQVSEHEFVNYDTLKYITENPQVRDGLSMDSIRWAFGFHAYASNWHPLTWLSHMLDCQLFGVDSPGAHHMVNVVLHIASTIVLFILLRRMTRGLDRESPALSAAKAEPAPIATGTSALRSRNLWQCALVAALFALHPLHVESVAWAAERKDVLSALFWMLTCLAYVEYATRPWSWVRYLLVPVMLTLGLMAKPMLVTLPFALLLLDYWPLERFDWGAWSNSAGRRRLGLLLVEKLPLFALAAASSVITYVVQSRGGAVRSLEHIPFVDRIANSLVGYGMYLYQMVWPLNLICFYPHPGTGLFSTPKFVGWIALSLAVLAAITTVSLLLARRKRYLLVGWLWYVGLMVPVIGLVQVGDHMIADRYTYIPLVGVFIMIVWGLPELLATLRVPSFVTATLGVAVVAAMSVLTYRQVGYWKDNFTLFSHVLDVDDDNFMAWASYGLGLMHQGKTEEGIAACRKAVSIKISPYNVHSLAWALDRAGEEYWDEAEIEYRKAIEINPKNWKAYGRLAYICQERGHPADAVDAYRKAIEYWPYPSEYPSRLSQALEELGRVDEAIDELQKATERNPTWAEAFLSLGMLQIRHDRIRDGVISLQRAADLKPTSAMNHLELAKALLRLNRPKDAFEHLQEAVRINDRYAEAYAVLGDFFIAARQKDDGLEAWERAVKLAPSVATYRARLAMTLSSMDQKERAAEELHEAVRLSPGSAVLHSDLARVLVELGRLDEAVEQLQRAVELKPDSAMLRIDLAGTCLRAKRYEEGLEYAQSAIDQDPSLAAAHNCAGRLLTNLGRLDEAVEALERAVELDSDSEAFRADVARVMTAQGKFHEQEGRQAEAIKAYRRGLSLKSDDVNLINNLAWVLATVTNDDLRDGEEAVRLAELACNLTEFRNVALIDTLAAAYAEAGRFSDAVETAQKAIQIADESGQADAVDDMRKKLALYQAGQPYHQQ